MSAKSGYRKFDWLKCYIIKMIHQYVIYFVFKIKKVLYLIYIIISKSVSKYIFNMYIVQR